MPLEVGQHGLDTIFLKNLIRQGIQHRAIQLFHRHRRIVAKVITLAYSGLAFVVAILPALACHKSHSSPAAPTLEQARQQGLGTNDARRHHLECTGCFALLHCLESFFINDGFDGVQHPFGSGLGNAGLIVLLVE
ncbi:MAG: hypothetical protein WC100_13535 [Sterolibacterium sp.]